MRRYQDEFTGVSHVVMQLELEGPAERTLFRVLATPPEESGTLGSFTFFLPGGWRYLECHHTHALADSTRVALGEATQTGDVTRRGGVTEHVRFEIPSETLVTMSEAQESVRIRVCSDVYTLDGEALVSLRRLRALIEGAAMDWPDPHRRAPGPSSAQSVAVCAASVAHECTSVIPLSSAPYPDRESPLGFWLGVCGTRRFYGWSDEADNYVESSATAE